MLSVTVAVEANVGGAGVSVGSAEAVGGVVGACVGAAVTVGVDTFVADGFAVNVGLRVHVGVGVAVVTTWGHSSTTRTPTASRFVHSHHPS